MNKQFLSIWTKEITSDKELIRRLKKKASQLINDGDKEQFFINGEARYLVKENNQFKIVKN